MVITTGLAVGDYCLFRSHRRLRLRDRRDDLLLTGLNELLLCCA